MSTVRQYLYDNFENFDKPTEDDFKVLIDFAGEPTTYLERTVQPVTDILTDLNAETFILDVRVIYIITYGNKVYFLHGIEGTYGLLGQAIVLDNVSFVGTISAGDLTEDLDVNTTIANSGIAEGDSYPAGTSFETIFRDMFIVTKISNFSYIANNTTGFLNVGQTLSITTFTWTPKGEPLNLNIADSQGQYNQNVAGSQQTVTESYTYNTFQKVTWTLSGSNVSSQTFDVYWVEPTYFGVKGTAATPNEAEILLGSNISLLTSESITVPVASSENEYAWIAVDAVQTNKLYSQWEISAFNTASIGSTEFIKYAGDVTVGGNIYNVYMYNYKSEVSNIKLF